MKPKIENLTASQEAKVLAYRQRYFAQATSMVRADRPKAEAAARRMAEIGGVKVERVVWANSPEEGKRKYDEVWASLRASLRASISDSLWASLGASLWASLSDSLWASLRDSIRNALWASLRDSIRASISDSLSDSGWLAFYTFGRDELAIEYDVPASELLHLHEEIAASCFALWILPGAVILCERPTRCETVDGRLVGIEWAKEKP
jgi:hypothetical protein